MSAPSCSNRAASSPPRSRPTSRACPRSATRAARHNIRFYLVAVTFLIFDVELLFFYPWALYFNMIDDQLSLFLAGVVFILILAVAFVYEWRKGALDWNR